MSTPGTLPPGPPLPAFVQTAMMLRHWSRFVSACRRRYGDVFTLRIASMGTWVYLADPADIKTVFAGDPTVFHAGEANSMLSGLLGLLISGKHEHAEEFEPAYAPTYGGGGAIDPYDAGDADDAPTEMLDLPTQVLSAPPSDPGDERPGRHRAP